MRGGHADEGATYGPLALPPLGDAGDLPHRMVLGGRLAGTDERLARRGVSTCATAIGFNNR